MKLAYAFMFGLALSMACLAAVVFGGWMIAAPPAILIMGVWGWPGKDAA